MRVPKMNAKKKLTPAQKDFNEEMKFAKKYIKNDKVIIEDFKYNKSYQETMDQESSWWKGRVLICGCGPLPLTVLSVLNCVDGIDKSLEAVEMAKKVIDKYEISDCKIFHYSAQKFMRYDRYGCIILTLEAGATKTTKKKILQHIHSQMNKKTTLIVRSSKTKDFVDSSKLFEGFKVIDVLDIFDGLSVSYILKKK